MASGNKSEFLQRPKMARKKMCLAAVRFCNGDMDFCFFKWSNS